MKLCDKKVCIINTGGTIGMVPTDLGYATQKGYLNKVLPEVLKDRDNLPSWEIVELDELLDSSNISIREWQNIAELVYINYEKFDGFVILHGTDTMAYTASALSFIFKHLSKPVVLTGSQIPICQVRSDAQDNLITSCIIAAQGICPEVCLYFGGKLLRGCRATKVSSDQLAAFESPNYPPLATADIDIKYDTSLIRKPNVSKPFSVTKLLEDSAVAVLKLFPGIQFDLFEGIMTERLKGLVVEAFGTGNIPKNESGFLPIVEKAKENGTVIIVCTQCLKGSVMLGTYEASAPLLKAGAVSGFDMTVEAAVSKLYYLFSCGLNVEEVRAWFVHDMRGEMTVGDY